MADDTGEVLRRSLDAVDQHRKRLILTLAILGVLLFGVFMSSARPSAVGGDMIGAFLAHFFILVIWVTALAVVIVIQITVMTKRILRAIEIAWRQ
jgi:hypothetical protein